MPPILRKLLLSITLATSSGILSGAALAQDQTTVEDLTSGRAAHPLAPLRTVRINTSEGEISGLAVSKDGKWVLFGLLGQIAAMPIGCTNEATVGCGDAFQVTAGPGYFAGPRFSQDGRYAIFWGDDMDGRWRRVPLSCIERRSARCPAELLIHTDTAEAVVTNRWEIRTLRDSAQIVGADTSCEAGQALLITDKNTGEQTRVRPQWHACPVPTVQTLLLGTDPEKHGWKRVPVPQMAVSTDGQSIILAGGGGLHRVSAADGAVAPIPFHAQMTLRVRPLQRFTHRVPEDSLPLVRRIEHPRISPDGSRLVFSALNHIWIMALPGGTPRRLTLSDKQGEFEPEWSPDGRYLAFVTWSDEAGGAGHVVRVRADSACTAAASVGPCAPERLTHESAHYSDVVYSPDGAKLAVVIRPMRWLRRQPGPTDWRTEGEAELAWLPADGGTAVHVSMLRAENVLCQLSRGTLNASPHFMAEVPDSVLLFQMDSAYAGSLRQLPLSDTQPGGVRRSPLLTLRAAWGAYSRRCADVLISPDRRRAVIWFNQRELLLVDRKSAADFEGKTLDELAASARQMPSRFGHAEFPAWSKDGNYFTYSDGRHVYRYYPAVADSLIQDSIARSGTPRAVKGSAYVPDDVEIKLRFRRDLPTGTIALRNARIITMRGTEVIERGDLVIRDRRIVAVGPAGRVHIPSTARVVDAEGLTVIPGLVDLHNHVGPLERIHRTRAWQLEANLAHGVLTSRDPQAHLTDYATYEDLQAAGEILSPRFRSTGRGIGSISFDSVGSYDDAHRIVSRYVDLYGARYLKEYELMPRDARQWLVMAAAERGINITKHGSGRHGLIEAATDGYGGFDHIYSSHLPLLDDIRQLVAATGITLAHAAYYSPTMRLFFEPMAEMANDPALQRWYPPAYRQRFVGAWTSEPHEYDRWSVKRAAEIATGLKDVIASGGRVAIGGHGDQPGMATHFQIWALAELGGVTPLEALRSGTLRGAEALGLDKDLGSLEVGKLGDLIVLNANPLESIRATRNIRYVLFNGRLYDGPTLDELWPNSVTRTPHWWWNAN